ncbi:SusC/RagA family TonB-linked outer membrane protein [Rufibacter roseus]|uniref:SusC/RagA family TonB-linked outer membrane protein n=1 Tax=Rufibacter roseus TaxID=1567108 RepID=A0ABW2DJ49_9BACT|nr:TonB-dependent receptor [Rufibacter roseus]
MKKKLPIELRQGASTCRLESNNWRRVLLGLTFLMLSTLVQEVFAQQRNLTGKVTSAGGEPLPGVTVLVKGTTNGASTDVSGNYLINLAENQENGTLVFSYVGYTPLEVPIAGQSVVNAVLQADEQTLNEVVVIGYQTVRKRDLTGAVAVVDTEQASRVSATTVAESIQGLSPGVTVRTTGRPGQGAAIEIRGAASFRNTAPLYVIDGMLSDANTTVNTNDIESIQILKDASAAAIYGSRAGNGVIIITTKQGREGPAKVEFSAKYGIQQIPKRWDLMNASEFAALQRVQFENAGLPAPPSVSDEFDPSIDTDWQEEAFQLGNMQDYNLNVSGGSETSTYMVSGSFFSNKGVLIGHDFERGSLRINTRSKRGRVSFGENLLLTNTVQERPAGGNPFYDIPRMLPVIPVRSDSYIGVGGNNPRGFGIGNANAETYAWNSIAVNELWRTRDNFAKLIGNGFVEVKVADWLTYKFDAGLEVSFDHTRTIRKRGDWRYNQNSDSTRVDEARGRFLNTKFDHTLNFTKDFGVHHIDGVVGVTQQTIHHEGATAGRTFLQVVDGQYYTTINSAGGAAAVSGDVINNFRNLGYLGRVNYVLKDRYLFTVTARVDQDSRFGEAYRTGFFPSFSAAWRLSEEEFFNVEWVNNLKINASYGTLGINTLGSWDYIGYLNSNPRAVFGPNGSEIIGIGAYQARLTNPDLRWESRIVQNLGFDAGLFNNKLTLEFNAYNSESRDVLVNLPIALYLGNLEGDPPVNAASIRNRGFEFGATYRNSERALKWDVSVNATTIKNEVLDLGNRGRVQNYISTGLTRSEVGRPLGEWYVMKTAGIFQNYDEVYAHVNSQGTIIQPDARPGDIRFVDINDDGRITEDGDRTYVGGSPWPTLQTGAQFNASYKNFSVNLQLVGVFGNKIYNGVRRDLDSYQLNNFRRDINPWREDNTNTTDPRLGLEEGDPAIALNNAFSSDRWLENGSYVRVRNLEVGYALPKAALSRIGFGTARIFVSGQNLITFTKYSGLDPDVVGSGILDRGFDSGNWPASRIFSFGIQCGF